MSRADLSPATGAGHGADPAPRGRRSQKPSLDLAKLIAGNGVVHDDLLRPLVADLHHCGEFRDLAWL
ncbi:MAG: hypothetical protein U0904_08070 [Candidatus Nanopelagicales bacterium]|nr:hypothetical protein [Candidatus Nanopelagicales bacterium]